MEEVEAFIRTDGFVELKVRGAKGRKCEELTRPLEAVLGGGIIERTYTEEYYQVELVEKEEVHLQKKRL